MNWTIPKTTLLLVAALICALTWGAAIADRPAHGSLDDFSTALTLTRDSSGFTLTWTPAAGLSYWAVLFSQTPDMANSDTLTVTTDTFYVHRDVEGYYNLGFFRVDPVDLAPPPDTAIAIQSFENAPTLLSIAGEDLEPGTAEITDADFFGDTGHALRMYGNTWKRIALDPYQVEHNTVFAVAAKLLHRGEIQAFGVADSAEVMYYILWGKEAPQSLRWNTVYEGWFDSLSWQEVLFPIGEDWYGRFGYLPRLTEVRFINDNDTVSLDGEVLFDEVRDVTANLPYAPVTNFNWTVLNHPAPDSFEVVFHSQTYDLDSPWLEHRWDFGDGNLSPLTNPTHVFPAHGRYSVTLTVTDSDEQASWISHTLVDTPVTAARDLWFSFTGDVIMGRGYENNNGIIETWGVDTLYEPTYQWLQDADLTSVNLECPLTTADTPHPTKGIVFKSRPEHVSGLVNAGVDFATLANNHVFDYLTDGMLETMRVLDSVGIVNNGSGMNDELARRVKFLSRNGLSIAMLSFSDRTGSYNNVQPFLDAGRARPGFAMWNRAAIESTLPDADSLSDFIVVNTHSGSEYSLAPILQMNAEQDPFGDEDMLFELVPDTLERQLRQYAIDMGAELVIAHHPHIIQGFEVYDGKLIAHSLGNFIFDLTYSETMPSVILRTHLSSDVGVDSAYVHPVYINHWIPQPARGALARNILDYETEMSRRLGTWLLRAPDADSAFIVFDTLSVFRSVEMTQDTLALAQEGAYWVSAPRALPDYGYVINANSLSGAGLEVRFGRELLYFGNMEDEGANDWLLNSADEEYSVERAHSGARSVRLRRASGNPQNVVANNEYRLRITPTQQHSILGWITTESSLNAVIQAQYFSQRSGGTALGQSDIGAPISGTSAWVMRHDYLSPPANTSFITIRMSLNAPMSGTGYAWFDDLSFVQWDNWTAAPATIPFPNDYHYVQVRLPNSSTQGVVQLTRSWVDG